MSANKHSHIIKIAVAVLSLSTVAAAFVVCALFPSRYAAEADAAADEFGLDRALVRSVIWAESKFDSAALSDRGAVGLMQLMPDTLEEGAAALNIYYPDGTEPRTSLRCGCRYLSLMLERFGDERAALMAYNAGPSAAERFLKGEEVFPETEKYLRDVYFAKPFYTAVCALFQ